MADAWNSQNPEKISQAYSFDSKWRNRNEFIIGRAEIIQFLHGKWEKELDYRLVKELWCYKENRIAVRFVYEWRDITDQWCRSYGNENWVFNEFGLMSERHASINDLAIRENQRKFLWEQGPRPEYHPGLTELGL